MISYKKSGNLFIFVVSMVLFFLPQHAHAQNSFVVFGAVIDKDTGKPISNAIVYVGRGSPGFERVYTDTNGEYRINMIDGQYSLGVYKKGYYRFIKYISKLSESKNNFELQKSDIPIEGIALTGRIIKQVTNPGTRNENHYIKIKTEAGATFYLFDELGSNDVFIFSKWLNRMVRIKGYMGMGKVGWTSEDAEGIYAETIETLY